MTATAHETVGTLLHLVGGSHEEGRGSFEVRDPGRPDDVVAVVADGGAAEVDRAVAAARAAGPGWAGTAVAERIARIEAGLETVTAAGDDLAETLARENGALRREARLDLDRSIALFRSLLDLAPAHLEPVVLDSPADRVTIHKKPVGVVGIVVPWNSPMVLAASKVAPALVTGSTVVVKPSPEAPVALTRALALLARSLPDGVVNVVNSTGDAGPALTAHPDVRKISFTGSTQVGRQVMAGAAGTLKRISLELGGNDPAVLLDDIDVESVVGPLAAGAFTRAGQICFGVKRVYVARSRYDELVEALRAHLAGFTVGHGLTDEVSFGPVINQAQAVRLRELVDRTRASGASVTELGSLTDEAATSGGAYLLPTLVTGIGQDAELVATEQFGPVLPVLPYDTVDEAVALANDSEFGLASSVWATDVERAAEVALRLEAGCTFVNSHNLWSLSFAMPFGGVKQSGIGRERTALGLQEYVEDHAIRWIKPSGS
ncbi:aldehyde dehydrogenase family protein [Streptomyces sp. VNUA24]|uniref:aldehyde dehydrogenase family protein n=1 Tax=Streptomyces sp. VNUA24 TaxID=3031131 RepID=UPI0023B84132|nr:aldehyde dehydrogenase family protein [Streptomyces sp. VNUA24]WEH12936.1 aldehyde dehydrogenase family protein [Streptomyces sp. VNUA24]